MFRGICKSYIPRNKKSKQKEFDLGERVKFSAREFSEILLYVQSESERYLQALGEYTQKMGIEQSEK